MKKKIIVRIAEGLGNQMFMYANSFAIAKNFNAELIIDNKSGFFKKKNRTRGQEYKLDIFNINNSLADKYQLFDSYYSDLKRKLLIKTDFLRPLKYFYIEKINKKKQTSFNKFFSIEDFKDIFFIEGHYESEYYFLDYKYELQKKFSIKSELIDLNNIFCPQLKKTNSVSVHIRNHRFSEDGREKNLYYNINKSKLFTETSIAYAKRGMNFFKERLVDPTFFIWSNDFKNLYNQFKGYNCIYINNDNNIIDDFYLFSFCKHFIVSPSSFHWWGAWLNNNDDKICVRPKNINQSNNRDFWPNKWIPI